MDIVVLAEHDRGVLAGATLEALTFARSIGDAEIAVLVCGDHDFTDVLGAYGASSVHVAEHDLLDADFGPDAWGQTLALWIEENDPDLVLACGTSKGNEVLAQAAARLDLPFVANVVELDDDADEMTRVQWGGSLLERASLEADSRIVSVAHHAVEAMEGGSTECSAESFAPELDDSAALTIVQGREIAEAGVTLATAPVVVSGGRARSAAQTGSRRWKSSPSSSVDGSAVHGPSPTTGGDPTRTRSVRPVPGSLPRSTSPAGSPVPFSIGWGRWRARTSWPSTPIRTRTW